MSFKKSSRKLLRLFLSITLFLVVIFYIGVEKIYTAFLAMDIAYLPFIFLLILLTIFLTPLGLLVLYRPILSKDLSLRNFYTLRLSTSLFGLFTPGRLGDFSLLLFLKRFKGTSRMQLFYILLLDKLLTLFHAFLFAFLGFVIIFRNFHASVYVIIFIFLLLLSFIGFNYLMKKIGIISRKLFKMQKAELFLQKLATCSKSYLKTHSFSVFTNFLFTFLLALFTAYITKVTYAAFSVDIPLITTFLINSILGVIYFIPLNFFGFGIKEVTSIYLYALVGIKPEITLSTIVIFTVFRYLSYFLYYLMRGFRIQPA